MFGDHKRRVMVVAGGRLLAEALMFALDSDPEIDAIGYSVEGWDAFGLVSTYQPDAVVVGPDGPDLDQLHLTRLLGEFFPEIAQIAVCSGPDRVEATRETGVAVCLPDSCSADELLHAITSALRHRRSGSRNGRYSQLRVLHASDAHA